MKNLTSGHDRSPSTKFAFTAIAFVVLVFSICTLYAVVSSDIADYQETAEADRRALESNEENLRILGILEDSGSTIDSE